MYIFFEQCNPLFFFFSSTTLYSLFVVLFNFSSELNLKSPYNSNISIFSLFLITKKIDMLEYKVRFESFFFLNYKIVLNLTFLILVLISNLLLITYFDIITLFISSIKFELNFSTLFIQILIFPIFLYFFTVLNFKYYIRLEEYLFLLLIWLSFILLFGCDDFLSFILNFEIISFVLYLLANSCSFLNHSRTSKAAIYYLIPGLIASIFLITGLTLIYGFSGLISFKDCNLFFNYVSLIHINFLTAFYVDFYIFILSFVFILFSFLFKLSVFPFHFWLVEVYEKISDHILFFFLVFTKLFFYLIMLKKFLFMIFCSLYLKLIFLSFGFVTLAFGSLFAISQFKLSKILAYSSISNIGFVIILLYFNNFESLFTTIFFLVSYSFLLIFLISIFLHFSTKATKPTFIKLLSEMRFLYSLSQLQTLFIIVSLFSLLGLPPLIGFFPKFLVLSNFFITNYLGVFLCLLFISFISCFYYLRIIFEVTYLNLYYPSNMIGLIRFSPFSSYQQLFNIFFFFLILFFYIFANYILDSLSLIILHLL